MDLSFYDDFKNNVKKDEFYLSHGFNSQPQTVTFDRQKAVWYAHHYWSQINTHFPYLRDNDCTNFVSQCWNYAGIPVSEGWFCDKTASSHAWTLAGNFADYMVSRGYCRIAYSSTEANLGDVIQFYNDSDGWHHSAIITAKDENGNLKYSAHSDPHCDRDLSEVYPGQGEQIRFLCPYNAY
ncbi:Hypothetical protein LUCI_3418 [Lucifera butyrica]|uniref:Putative amidase domain-containing protein n=1 Tax=Lucifera butyrica TaxID=1351585 RepID=A0A498RDK4_9FIRM|nr:amidase domain-containing protein [Lucifera butyrica]VBB08153.1 Hypothetical protein LUCI_3418 [Lucifera butyrica]